MELYSAFYITEICQDLPTPAYVVEGPSSSRRTYSPLPSPEKEEETGEIQRLTTQLKAVQTIAKEQQEQLWEKSEALIKSHTENVKNLYELAQFMKEKLESMALIDEGKKALEASRIEADGKDRENQSLKAQLQDPLQLQEQLKCCQEELHKAQQDNSQLRAELHRQTEELEQQKIMFSHISTMAQPSMTSAISEPKNVVTPSLEFFTALWSWEARGPVPRELFQLYEYQRDLLFLTLGVT